MTPRLPRAEALAWVERTLLTELRLGGRPAKDFAEWLVTCAEQYSVPDDSLIFWIQDQPAGKDWSLAAWRAWCDRYAEAAAQLPPEASENDVTARDPLLAAEQTAAPEESMRGICTRCFANVAQRIAPGRWWCATCGEVER